MVLEVQVQLHRRFSAASKRHSSVEGTQVSTSTSHSVVLLTDMGGGGGWGGVTISGLRRRPMLLRW